MASPTRGGGFQIGALLALAALLWCVSNGRASPARGRGGAAGAREDAGGGLRRGDVSSGGAEGTERTPVGGADNGSRSVGEDDDGGGHYHSAATSERGGRRNYSHDRPPVFRTLGDGNADVAVCIAGGRGVYLERFRIFEHVLHQVVMPLGTADVFIHSDAKRSAIKKTVRALRPVKVKRRRLRMKEGYSNMRRWQAGEGIDGTSASFVYSNERDVPFPRYEASDNVTGETVYGPGEMMTMNVLRAYACFQLVKKHERKRGRRYSIIHRIRPDEIMRFGMDLSGVYDSMKVSMANGFSPIMVRCFRKGWICDHPAMVPRSKADVFFAPYAHRILDNGGIAKAWIDRNCEGFFIECVFYYWGVHNGLFPVVTPVLENQIVRECNRDELGCGYEMCGKEYEACGQQLPPHVFLPIKQCRPEEVCREMAHGDDDTFFGRQELCSLEADGRRSYHYLESKAVYAMRVFGTCSPR